MIREYIPVLLQAIVAVGFASGALIISVLLGKSGIRTRTKDSAYECGMLPIGEAQPRFSVKFYLVAVLFLAACLASAGAARAHDLEPLAATLEAFLAAFVSALVRPLVRFLEVTAGQAPEDVVVGRPGAG